MKRNKTNKKLKRRGKSLQESEEGVAATVGTIMALLVFLSLLSLITQQYVPVWMEDKEAYHMDEVMVQFSYLKGDIDNLVMNDYTDYPLYSSIRLGSEGVPLFASQTAGVMRMQPSWGGISLDFTDNGAGRSFTGRGNLSLEVLNRYFEKQTVVYEYGAIILDQGEGSVIRADPAMDIVEHSDGNFSVRMTLFDLVGENETIAGTGTVGITSELWGTSQRTVESPDNVFINMTTSYPKGWYDWLGNKTDLTKSHISPNPGGMNENSDTLTLDLSGETVTDIQFTYSRVNMKFST